MSLLKPIKNIFCTLLVFSAMVATMPSYADLGERVDRRLDAKGERINNRLDRRSEFAESHGRYQRANKLDRAGDRIEHRLDRVGDRIDRKLDRQGR